MANPTTSPLGKLTSVPASDELEVETDAARERRLALKSRHSHALVKLLDERDDLRGVHALADMVAESLRWSA